MWYRLCWFISLFSSSRIRMGEIRWNLRAVSKPTHRRDGRAAFATYASWPAPIAFAAAAAAPQLRAPHNQESWPAPASFCGVTVGTVGGFSMANARGARAREGSCRRRPNPALPIQARSERCMITDTAAQPPMRMHPHRAIPRIVRSFLNIRQTYGMLGPKGPIELDLLVK